MANGFINSLRENPATAELGKALAGFAVAQAGSMAGKVSGKGDDSAEAGAAEGAAEATSEGKSGIWGGIKGAMKKILPGGTAKRPTNIYEQQFLGVPVERAWAEWTNYSQFPEFMKGPEKVEVNDDGTTSWTAKIFLNRRSWKATVVEEVENRRVRWTTEAPKGTVDGVVTFTPVGENLTLMSYVLEYRPKGFFEWWGNRWRTVGRRARLDVKHFGRHVMMLPDEQEEETEEEEQPDESGTAEESDQSGDTEESGEPERGGESEESGESERAERTKRRPRQPRKEREPARS